MSDWEGDTVSDEYASDEDSTAAETTDDDADHNDQHQDGMPDAEQMTPGSSASSSPPSSPVDGVQQLLLQHATCTNRNALHINRYLQQQLIALRLRLEALLHQCRTKQAANQQRLENRQKRTGNEQIASVIRRRDKRQTSVLFYGAPFFKTVDCYSAPYNADYLRRRRAGELFPIELRPRIVHWTTNDKLLLIQGVREQVVAALQRQYKDRLRGLLVSTDGGTGGLAQKRDLLLASFTQTLAPRKLLDLMRMLDPAHGADDEADVGDGGSDADVIRIDWYTVAQQYLSDRHKTNECQAMWNGFVRPTLNRSAWTAAEDDRLMVAVVAHDQQNWPAIARQMDCRSSYQCLVHYRTKLFDHTPRGGRWSAAEDAQLLRLVQQLRIGSSIPWDAVSNGCDGRTRGQCYYRYMFTLCPDIRHDKFGVEEDCILVAAYKQYGLAFEKYMHMLPGRTRIQIRNRWKNVLRYENQQPLIWTQEADGRLLELVQELGEKRWAEVAERLGSHTRTSVRSRYMRIQSFLQRHPSATWQQMQRRTVHRATTVTTSTWFDTLVQLKQLKQQQQLSNSSGGELAEYLRGAYRLCLRPLVQSSAATTKRTETVCRLLHTQICPVDYQLLHAMSRKTISMRYLDPLVGELSARPLADGEAVVLPASWCTALLLRGLAVMFPKVSASAADGEDPAAGTSSSNSVRLQRPLVEPVEALQLFRRRLRTLLLNAAVMSRVSMALPQSVKVEIPVKVETPVEEGSFSMETKSLGAVRVHVTSRSRRGMKRKLPEEN